MLHGIEVASTLSSVCDSFAYVGVVNHNYRIQAQGHGDRKTAADWDDVLRIKHKSFFDVA